MLDAVVAVEHRHRDQDAPNLPRAEEDRRGFGRGRAADGDPVAFADAVGLQHVGGPVGQRLLLAPGDLAVRAGVVLEDHRQLVRRVPVTDVGGDVVALGNVPLVLGADLFVTAHRTRTLLVVS